MTKNEKNNPSPNNNPWYKRGNTRFARKVKVVIANRDSQHFPTRNSPVNKKVMLISLALYINI